MKTGFYAQALFVLPEEEIEFKALRKTFAGRRAKAKNDSARDLFRADSMSYLALSARSFVGIDYHGCLLISQGPRRFRRR